MRDQGHGGVVGGRVHLDDRRAAHAEQARTRVIDRSSAPFEDTAQGSPSNRSASRRTRPGPLPAGHRAGADEVRGRSDGGRHLAQHARLDRGGVDDGGRDVAGQQPAHDLGGGRRADRDHREVHLLGRRVHGARAQLGGLPGGCRVPVGEVHHHVVPPQGQRDRRTDQTGPDDQAGPDHGRVGLTATHWARSAAAPRRRAGTCRTSALVSAVSTCSITRITRGMAPAMSPWVHSSGTSPIPSGGRPAPELAVQVRRGREQHRDEVVGRQPVLGQDLPDQLVDRGQQVVAVVDLQLGRPRIARTAMAATSSRGNLSRAAEGWASASARRDAVIGRAMAGDGVTGGSAAAGRVPAPVLVLVAIASVQTGSASPGPRST